MADVTRYESCFTLLRVAALCAVLVSGIRPADAQWLSREDAIMGTAIRVELWTDDAAAGEAAIDAVMDEMRRIDREMSPFKPESELSRINREAADHPVPISAEMFDILSRSIEFSKLSGGAFDITFSSVGFMYDYRRHIKPTAIMGDKEIPCKLLRKVMVTCAHANYSSIAFAVLKKDKG